MEYSVESKNPKRVKMNRKKQFKYINLRQQLPVELYVQIAAIAQNAARPISAI